MYTPNPKAFIKWLNDWINEHKTLLTLLTVFTSGIFSFITSQLVFAEEFEQFKAETTQALLLQYEEDKANKARDDIQDAKIDLQQVNDDIEYYISEPNYHDNPRTMQRLESLERRKASLEHKINS